ncbi:copia protein [Tanacetum coccineum]
MEITVVTLVEEQMSSWKGNLPNLPIIIKYSAIGTRKYSGSGEEDDEKVKDKTCLVAHASSEVCSESSYFSDENSSIDDIDLDNEYDKLCKMSLKIITKNKRLKATRNSLENELRELKDKLSIFEKNKGVDLECEMCHVLKIENEKLKDESTRRNKFENSTHCLNEMLSNQKPSGDKLGLEFNSFEASSSGTKEIKFVKAQKKASSDGGLINRDGPINMGDPLNVLTTPKINKGPPPETPISEKSISFQKSILGPRPKHIIVNKVKVPVASDYEVKQFYKPLSKPGVGFSKQNFRSKTPPPRRVNNNYSRPKTPQPRRHVGQQNQPHGFPICLGVDLEPDEWIKDSRCSKHMTGNQKLFSTYKAYNGGNVIFGSNLCGNIIGKGQICDNKCKVTFSEHDSEITKNGKVIGYSQNSKAYIILNKHTRKIEESLNVTFDETPPPSKTSPLVDDDLDEEEAIREIEKKNLENDVEDETLEIDEIVQIIRYLLFTKKKSSNLIIVQIYVDDIIFGLTCQDMCDEFAKIMHDEFEMSMMGKLNFFLGLQIKQMEDGIFFNQSKYIKEMLKKFGLEDSKPMKTPMSSDTKLMKDEECESVDSTKYRGMIGDYVDRKSTSGICTFVGCCLTSWFSKKQTALAISTTEAEYVSAGKACQQALWMKQALIDYDFIEFECILEINEQVCPRFILEFYSQYQLSYSDEELNNESYVLYDHVMTHLAAQLERKPRRDRGMRRGRHSTSSSSAFDKPSSSHLNDV